jgi:hypothetical protein
MLEVTCSPARPPAQFPRKAHERNSDCTRLVDALSGITVLPYLSSQAINFYRTVLLRLLYIPYRTPVPTSWPLGRLEDYSSSLGMMGISTGLIVLRADLPMQEVRRLTDYGVSSSYMS